MYYPFTNHLTDSISMKLALPEKAEDPENMSRNTSEASLKVALEECKRELHELFELIRKLRNTEPDHFFRALNNMDPKEKAALTKFLEKGEICLKLMEIRNKKPTYIK